MTTPARNHFMRVSAALAAADEDARLLRHANGYELMLAQLAEHRRQLKLVQSVARKAEVKRRMLPEYAAWVEGVLAADAGLQDEVLMTVMVWRIDVGDFAGALPLAAYAIRHKLAMPDQYQRTTACLIAEEVANYAIGQATAGGPVDVDSVERVLRLVEQEDMPDEVRAKLHKALAYGVLALLDKNFKGDPQATRQLGLTHLRRALELHDKCGVKKDIERIERDIKNAAPPGAPEGDGKS
ncbi:terminase endonuclease subunit [Ralstonia holmesii]|uniref:phage terminase small subunit n=1 Tax=Ralstonia holmesii TaxID=3058602 RepID=UPI0028F6363E|nr:terminase endonuclease subunit [Ralstonia sp. LMG 32967]CAJ0703907.1 hypothetical protein R11007_04192 [Ralstonia sp. LMG 32967]